MDLSINHSNRDQQSLESNIISGLKILVVDDEIDSLEILIMILEQEGAELVPVVSADDALIAFDQTIDLIISDIGMPKTDGYSLIKKIRTLPSGQNIPAIALTAYANSIERQRSLDAGFQIHLAKPLIIPELIAAITELCC